MRESAWASILRILMLLALIVGVAAPLRAQTEVAELLRRTKSATLSGRWQEASAELDAAIQRAQAGKRLADEALLRAELGRVALEQHFYFRQNQPEAESLIRSSLEFAEKNGHPRAQALAHLQMARLSYTQARGGVVSWDIALQHAEHAIRGWAALDEPAEVANSVYIVGLVHQMRDGREQGEAQFARMLELAEAAADKEAMANAERHLGYVFQAKKDYARAFAHYERSLKLREEAGALVNVPFALITLAELHWEARQDRAKAMALLERAVSEAQRGNSVRAQYTARLALARHLKELGKTGAALDHAERALEGTRAFAATTAGKAAEELLDTLASQP